MAKPTLKRKVAPKVVQKLVVKPTNKIVKAPAKIASSLSEAELHELMIRIAQEYGVSISNEKVVQKADEENNASK